MSHSVRRPTPDIGARLVHALARVSDAPSLHTTRIIPCIGGNDGCEFRNCKRQGSDEEIIRMLGSFEAMHDQRSLKAHVPNRSAAEFSEPRALAVTSEIASPRVH